MTRIFDQMMTLFSYADWTLEVVPGTTIASVTFQSGDDAWVFVAATNEELRTMTIFARGPDSCPSERAAEMVDFFNRANFGMSHGAWILDVKDGEIRYRVGVDLAGRDVTGDELGAITNYINTVMSATLPALRAVIAGTATPESAMTMVFGGG
jgi:hypothetical protein